MAAVGAPSPPPSPSPSPFALLTGAPDTPPEPRRAAPRLAVLSGPPRCGKTSLLFQAAFRAAAAAAAATNPAVFVCEPTKVETNLPALPRDAQGQDAALKRIFIKYVESEDALLQFLCSVQELGAPSRPRLLALDDCSLFIRGDERELVARWARLLALAADCARFLASSTAGDPVSLLVCHEERGQLSLTAPMLEQLCHRFGFALVHARVAEGDASRQLVSVATRASRIDERGGADPHALRVEHALLEARLALTPKSLELLEWRRR